MEINKECGKRLRECFETSSFKTQQELADATGFSSVYINNIMTGKKPMTISAAKKFSEKLGVLEDYLLCKTSCRTNQERSDANLNSLLNVEKIVGALAVYNGLFIDKCFLKTEQGELIEQRSVYGLACCEKDVLLGKQTIDEKEYTIIDVEFEIRIHEKTYIVNADRIYEILKFVIDYLRIQRERLYHELENDPIL